MDITSGSLNKTAMERMKEKYSVTNPVADSWYAIHRMSEKDRTIAWDGCKQALGKLPANFESQIRDRVERNLVKIVNDPKTGNSYEYTFFLKGWECALIWKQTERTQAYYEAYNSHDGKYYRRDLLEVELKP